MILFTLQYNQYWKRYSYLKKVPQKEGSWINYEKIFKSMTMAETTRINLRIALITSL
jgi:hypothetical protein